MALEQTDLDGVVTDDSVLGYLKNNPEFFIHNQDILSRLRIPHDTGNAVSLIEKQVSVLRNRCGHLENSLRDLIAVARENENLHQRLHSLIQSIISAPTLEEIIALTQKSLRDNFNAEQVHILLISPAPKRAARKKNTDKQSSSKSSAPQSRAKKPPQIDGATVVSRSDKRVKVFSDLFESGSTQCGMPASEQLKALVGEDHAQVASAAMIPLHYQRKLGVIMLTSPDESRFASGRGVMFLNQLGDLLSRRIHSYGAPTPSSSK